MTEDYWAGAVIAALAVIVTGLGVLVIRDVRTRRTEALAEAYAEASAADLEECAGKTLERDAARITRLASRAMAAPPPQAPEAAQELNVTAARLRRLASRANRSSADNVSTTATTGNTPG